MRLRPIVFPLALLPLLVASTRDASAMGGNEGTFEFAIDAPWRIEPVLDAQNRATYGAIPISLVVLDENVIVLDSFRLPTPTAPLSPSGRGIGNFCDLTITRGTERRHFAFRDLIDLEMTGAANTTFTTGSWAPGKAAPPHGRCQPATESCAAFQSPSGTSEWYASAWYTPTGTLTPGMDIPLTAVATFTRSPSVACAGAKTSDLITLTNSLSVHLGDAPLPRFHDNRYAYGDLHFHGQGTDNEGEAGYNYRNIVRAMGAMGLDFVVGTDHASDSTQFLDIDYNGVAGAALGHHIASHNGEVQRDMSPARFAFLLGELWAADGVNKQAAIDGRSVTNAYMQPATVAGHGAAPQVYLGGEVDAMPEIEPNFASTGSFKYGNGLTYSLKRLCDGWNNPVSSCPQDQTVQQDLGVTILRDEQGYDALYPARVHLVYLPKDQTNTQGFVSSHTGIYGGAGRHLTRGNGVLPEMEQKGYAFLAHPISGGNCDGTVAEATGGPGPDVIPYTAMMLDQAFKSKAILGLELWNEDWRMKNDANSGATKETGFESSFGVGGHGMRNDEPKGFSTGAFSMYPWSKPGIPSYANKCMFEEWTLHHGLREWDDMLMRGIQPSQTAPLTWVPAGDPRRVFMAGGSDAHGDLNYHRSGYMLGLEKVDDMGIGKPRNLVLAGAPDVVVSSPQIPTRGGRVSGAGGLPGLTIRAHSQSQIAGALANGAFSVTDGPAVRIAFDRNGNGVIDDADIPMGGIAELYGDQSVPLLVEWDSTPEWGPVGQIDLVVGAVSSTDLSFQSMFAPVGNGPRSAGTPSTAVARTRSIAGHTFNDLVDGYTQDPSGMLRFNANSLSGHKKIELLLPWFPVGERGGKAMLPDRLYVRAFVRSTPGGEAQCIPDPKVGQCIMRYGFSNPLWAITPARAANTCPTGKPRAIDTDGDGLPDGCDPCPASATQHCVPKITPPNSPPWQNKL